MITKSSQFFNFEADDGCSADLDKIEKYMNWARCILLSNFPDIPIRQVTVRIYDHPVSTEVDCTTMRADTHHKIIRCLCPSSCKNLSEAYYRKNLLHEYTHLFTAKNCHPKWFREGIAEYVSVVQSDDIDISRQYASYFSEIKRQLLSNQLSFGNNMAYSWALHLIKFLLNKNPYGIRLILKENGPALEADLKTVYGFDSIQLIDSFWDWIGITYSLDIDDEIRQVPLLSEIERYLL